MLKSLSMRAQILILVFALASISVGALITITISQLRGQHQESIKQKAISITAVITESIGPGLEFGDSSYVADFAQGAFADDDVIGICICDENDVTIYRDIRNDRTWAEYDNCPPLDSLIIIHRPGICIVYQGITFRGRRVGDIWLALSTSAVDQRITSNIIYILASSLVVLFLVALIASAISRKITAPIITFEGAADRISGGDLVQPIETRNLQHNFIPLGNAFNKMQQALRDAFSEIKQARDNLELQVAERTSELKTELIERKEAEQKHRELQEQLERAERMESLGILAGGVAHDLNNILGPLVGYPELILMKLPADDPLCKHINRMAAAAQAAADVVQDLLTMARRGRYDLVPTDLNEVIRSFLDSHSFIELSKRNPQVQLDLQLTEKILPLAGSAIHLTKILLNLVVNAFEAMDEGGRLCISTTQEHLARLRSGYNQVIEGDYLILQIVDTGGGIEPKDLEKIFEPYYSTKVMGHSGSGLGLSVVYGVVKDHHGYYDIFSKVGEGTEFVLYFPMTRTHPKPDQAQLIDATGDEQVLIVDDNDDQRTMARELLASLGYDVATAADGHGAVDYLHEHAADVVVLDMIMEEGFDGLDTYREIIKLHPGQKAIIVSGFSATERVQQMQQLGAGRYVRKPYTRETIGLALRTELDRKTSTIIS